MCLKNHPYSSGDSDDSDTDPKDQKMKLMNLFVPLNVSYDDDGPPTRAATYGKKRHFSTSTLPQWLMDIDFNKRVQMEYVSPPHSRKQVLEKDKRRMESMRQPQLVKEQMSELFAALGKQVGEALNVGTLDVQYDGSSSDVAMDDERPQSRGSEPMVEDPGLSPRHAVSAHSMQQAMSSTPESCDSEPMAEGDSSDLSPQHAISAHDTQQTTSSSAAGTTDMQQRFVNRRPSKGKGGPVKRSRRKNSSVSTAGSDKNEKDTADKHRESDQKWSDFSSDSGAEMEKTPSEAPTTSSGFSFLTTTTDTPTISEKSQETFTSDWIATTYPGGGCPASTPGLLSLDTWPRLIVTSSPPVTPQSGSTVAVTNSPSVNKAEHMNGVNGEGGSGATEEVMNTQTSELLGSLFTDDDQSNI